jgi:hypothetical protein
MKKYYCEDCGQELNSHSAKKCRACYIKYVRIPENHPSFKDGRTFKKYYCKCGKEINIHTALRGEGRI